MTRPWKLTWLEALTLILTLASLLYLAKVRLPNPALDIDQILYIEAGRQPVAQIIQNTIDDDSSPGLAFITYKGWMSLLGIDEAASFKQVGNQVGEPVGFWKNPIVKLRLLPFLAFLLASLA